MLDECKALANETRLSILEWLKDRARTSRTVPATSRSVSAWA